MTIKEENDPFVIIDVPPTTNDIVPSHSDKVKQLTEEKSKIIDELLTLKADNQKMFYDLKLKQQEIDSLKAEAKSMKIQFETLEKNGNFAQNQVTQLKLELKKSLAHIEQLENINKENIPVINECNNDVTDNSSNDSNASQVYEVQKILNHRVVRGKRLFFIRWKGFDENEDSWVKEKDLNCPELLEKYIKSLP